LLKDAMWTWYVDSWDPGHSENKRVRRDPYLGLVRLFVFDFLLSEALHFRDARSHPSAVLDFLFLTVQP